MYGFCSVVSARKGILNENYADSCQVSIMSDNKGQTTLVIFVKTTGCLSIALNKGGVFV